MSGRGKGGKGLGHGGNKGGDPNANDVKAFISEGHDDFYRQFLVQILQEREAEDDESTSSKARLLEALKGLHTSPAIACKTSSNGVVSVDVNALREYLAGYFGMPCEPFADHDGEGDKLFELGQGKDYDDIVREVWHRSLSLMAANSEGFDVFSKPAGLVKQAVASCACEGGPGREWDAEYMQIQVGKVDLQSLEPAPLADCNDSKLAQAVANLHDLAVLALKDDRLDPESYYNDEMMKATVERIESERPTKIRGPPRKSPLSGVDIFSDSDMQRILRRGGVLTESEDVYDEMRGALKVYLEHAMRDAVTYCENRRSKILNSDDLIVTKPGGVTPLGYGGTCGVRNVWAEMIYRVLKQVHPNSDIDPTAMSAMCDINTFVMARLLAKAQESRASVIKFQGPAPTERPDEGLVDDRAFGYFERSVSRQEEDDPTGETVRIYDNDMAGRILEEEDTPEGYHRLDEPIECLTSRDIQTAVRLVIPGELAKHAVSEGTKAVTKFTAA